MAHEASMRLTESLDRSFPRVLLVTLFHLSVISANSTYQTLFIGDCFYFCGTKFSRKFFLKICNKEAHSSIFHWTSKFACCLITIALIKCVILVFFDKNIFDQYLVRKKTYINIHHSPQSPSLLPLFTTRWHSNRSKCSNVHQISISVRRLRRF